ncbi:MAG: homoserine dehydrogenase [Oscillospiraceae bacterium]|nr:homoserine dehydrogenase [Oscillospiraceae bacterium]
MKVSVLGYGTVGVGVCSMLEKAPGLELVSVLVRPGKADRPFKVTSIEDIVNDPEVEAVVEVMGGVEPAYSFVSAALAAGKHAVTSNKALVAARGPELAALAAEKGAAFLFSAACGGAVPFLHNLSLAVESDRILSLGGILNGTTNFMLDSMQRAGMDYSDALREAQDLGYAEADPTADVSGLDALRKIMLACAVAYDKLPCEGFSLEGIESVTAADVAHFQKKGLVLRLVVSGGESEDGRLYAFVQPMLLPASSPEASVLKNFNMAKYRGENAGDIVLIGQGAGRYPTASAVVRDLSDIVHGRRAMMKPSCVRVAADNSVALCRYYVRLPAEKADALPLAEKEVDGALCRGVTESLPVTEMHARVKALREEGAEVFFAAMEE